MARLYFWQQHKGNAVMRVVIKQESNIMAVIGGRLVRAPVGHEIEVSSMPNGWAEFVDVLADDADRVAVVNPSEPDLASEYKQLTGKSPDKRWNIETLMDRVRDARDAV